MSFTFKKNNTYPIAIIRKNNVPRFIYMSDGKSREVKKTTPGVVSILDEKLDSATIAQVVSSLEKGLTIREMYNILERSSEAPPEYDETFTEYKLLPGEKIEPLLSDESERIFNGGEAGCGKTYMAALLAKQYLAMNPSKKVTVFVRQSDDPAFDGIPRSEIVLGDSGFSDDGQALINGDMTMENFEDSFVIFDDMDNIQDKKLLTAVHKLMNDLVTSGRKKNIYVLYITHLLNNYAQTRVISNEANKVFFYPGCGTAQIESYLFKHASIKKKEAEKIAMMKSRWAMLSKRRPRYILHENGIFVI